MATGPAVLTQNGTCSESLITGMQMFGVLRQLPPSRFLTAVSWLGFRVIGRSTGYGSPVLRVLETEAVLQAVRTGHTRVATAHLLLALLSLDQQMADGEHEFVKGLGRFNQAAQLLKGHGLRLPDAARLVEDLSGESEVYSRDEAKRFIEGANLADPIWGRRAGEILDRALALKQQYKHRSAGTSHLLQAMLADRSTTTYRLLVRAGVDVDELTTEVGDSLKAA